MCSKPARKQMNAFVFQYPFLKLLLEPAQTLFEFEHSKSAVTEKTEDCRCHPSLNLYAICHKCH